MFNLLPLLVDNVVVSLAALALLGALGAVLLLKLQMKNYGLEAAFSETLPALIWSEDPKTKDVIWANQAFKSQRREMTDSFLNSSSFKSVDDTEFNSTPSRATVSLENEAETLFFDLSVHEYNGQQYYFAQSAQSSARAEQDRERFVKSMSETFAHLPIGVAVFDKHRDLSLFNPALSDLLGLAPSWLASRPSLRAFLDRLHDKGDMPEPRDFKVWRDSILSLESSAANKMYFDDWNLTNGSVYRITGQSYPRGAVALFIEDISSQVAVETEYRLEIRRLYNTFDAMDSGIAIFNASGELSFSNAAFEDMWDIEISNSVLVPDIVSISKIWQGATEPTPVWGDLRDFVTQLEQREVWSTNLLKKDGQWLEANFSPLVDGHTLCSFSTKKFQRMPEVIPNAQSKKSLRKPV